MSFEQQPNVEHAGDASIGARPQRQLRAVRVIWFVLFATVGLYFCVARYLPVGHVSTPGPAILYGISGVAIVVAVVNVVMPARLTAIAFRGMRGSADEESTQLDGSYRGGNPRRLVLRLDEAGQRGAILRYQMPLVLSLAFSNSIALFGLVLSRLGFELRFYAPFFVVAGVLVAVRAPSWGRVVRAIKAATGADVELR